MIDHRTAPYGTAPYAAFLLRAALGAALKDLLAIRKTQKGVLA